MLLFLAIYLATWRKQSTKLYDCKLLMQWVLLVEQRGIEPLTSALRTRRSAKLSYCPTRARIQFRVSSFKFRVVSERGAAGTRDHRLNVELLIRSLLLDGMKRRLLP